MLTLAAMSGGVDSSVAAALLVEEGHDVVGVTLKLWGGPSDTGCCSASDVQDARRVADSLGIEHHVFNFGEDFSDRVVDPYTNAHASGRTPNPCVECNRHIKFDRLLRRAEALGFDAVATGHHARIVDVGGGSLRVGRGADAAKDQSYVLYMLGQGELSRLSFPVGELTKAQVRSIAERLGLVTASKPDSMGVCFIKRGSRSSFLAERLQFTPAVVVDSSGQRLGEVPALELLTVGQRRGVRIGGRSSPAYVVDVDPHSAKVTLGGRSDLMRTTQRVEALCWADEPVDGQVEVQTSAHGVPRRGSIAGSLLTWSEPQPRVAPGQSLVFYADGAVLGGGVAAP